MDRRTFLGRCAALGGAAALTGCTEQSLEEAKEPAPLFDALYDEEEVDLPVEQEFESVAREIRRADGETFDGPDAFAAFLEEEGLTVEHAEPTEVHGETVLELEYVPEAAIEEGNGRSVGLVAGAYAALVRGGFDGHELDATMLDADDRPFGSFAALTTWAEDYDAGAVTARTYASDVLHTLESR